MMKIKALCTLIGVFSLTLLWTMPSSGKMVSPSYRVPAHTLDGGGLKSFSGSFRLVGAIGQSTPIGVSQSTGLRNKAGFIPQITGKECDPTLIELDQLSAVSQKDSIVISWNTLSESDTVGFYLWRSESENGEYIRINPGIIEAEGGATLRAGYAYSDDTAKAGIKYYYKLEDIDTKGGSTFHGMVSAVITDTRTAK